MSLPPFILTKIPRGNIPMEAQMEAALKEAETFCGPEGTKKFREANKKLGPNASVYISDSPVSCSNPNQMPFVRPQIDRMSGLAKQLGLDKEGGWKSVWKEMDLKREKLCKLVPYELEWSNEKNAGNTFTYCFCTKYLPLIISAAIDEPAPSIYASPYDLILRGACNTPLLQFYLLRHPDKAIQLRDVYYKKVLDAAILNLELDACYKHLLPHLGVIHTCIVAYYTSDLSTSSQKTPPPPLKADEATRLAKLNLALITILPKQAWDFPWSQNVPANYFAYTMTLSSMNIAKKRPGLLNGEEPPAGFDWLSCGGAAEIKGCTERDPKKLKACSKCRVALYCCSDHQSHDWKFGTHKPICQKILWDE